MTNVFVENITTELEIEAGYDLFEVVIEDFDQAEIKRYAELAAESAAEALASEEAAADSAAQASASEIAAGNSATSASNSASSATNSANTATSQAGIATTQAGIATNQAGIATTKANEAAASAAAALASETDAETAATTATTQAGISTTQAGIATTQAGIATTQAGIATTQANTATTQAGIATTQAGNALTSANNAAASAVNAANSASQAAQVGTSTTLLGYTVGPNTPIAATDSILTAFGEVQGQINARVSGTIATGQVAFGTAANTVGGSNNLFWDNANGRLGLRTSTPALSLVVQSGVNNSDIARFTGGQSAGGLLIRTFFNGTSDGGVTLNANDALTFHIALTERWRINNTGILQSNGAQTIQTSTGNLTLATAAGNGNIVLSPNGVGVINLIGQGIAGIANLLNISAVGNGGSGRGTAIVLNASGSASSVQVARIVGYQETASATANNASFAIQVANSSATLTEYLRIFNTGNLVLQNGGTFTDAGFRLDVNGTARVQTSLIVGGSTINTNTLVQINGNANVPQNLTITNINAGTSAQCGVQTISDAGTGSFNAYSAAFGTVELQSSALLSSGLMTGGLILNTSASAPIRFRINAAEVARFGTNGSLGLGTGSSINASARLQVDSTTQGFLPPRMTTAQRDLIATPAAGLVIYNTTTNLLNVYNGTSWINS